MPSIIKVLLIGVFISSTITKSIWTRTSVDINRVNSHQQASKVLKNIQKHMDKIAASQEDEGEGDPEDGEDDSHLEILRKIHEKAKRESQGGKKNRRGRGRSSKWEKIAERAQEMLDKTVKEEDEGEGNPDEGEDRELDQSRTAQKIIQEAEKRVEEQEDDEGEGNPDEGEDRESKEKTAGEIIGRSASTPRTKKKKDSKSTRPPVHSNSVHNRQLSVFNRIKNFFNYHD